MLGSSLSGGLSTGCDAARDPSTPCGALQLGDADPGAVVNRRRAPVLAMAGGSGEPFVLHFVCASPDADEDDCELRRETLEGIGGGENAVLVTSAGDYIVATDRDEARLHVYSFSDTGVLQRHPGDLVLDDRELPVELIASLRNSNWIIGLDRERHMRRYMPTQQSADLVAAELGDKLTLATVGEQHIIGRVRHGEGDEALYLIPVDESLDVHHAPTLLMRGRAATRIVVGPRDEHVAITLGHQDNAQTLVFRVPDGTLIDRFGGELISGREDLTETVGLRAVSPDGSHLAYKTAAGSVALRDIDSNSACLVRSSTIGGDAKIAGFSAEGMLYFESEVGVGNATISAWDPAERYLAVLSTPEEDAHLVAVPSLTPSEALPWAVGVHSGTYMALADSQPATRLDLHTAVFIPRDDPKLWVLDSERINAGGRRVDVHRVTARTMPDASLRYGEIEGAEHAGPNGDPRDSLGVTVSGPQRACMSTGTPGARAYACGSGNDDRFLSGATAPQGEDPVRPATPSAEVPNSGGSVCSSGLGPVGDVDAGSCTYVHGGCCYGTEQAACDAADCPYDSCTVTGRTPECGTGAGFP